MDRMKQGEQLSLWVRLALLSLFFLCGILLGQVLAGRVPEEAGTELDRYLRDYVALDGGSGAFALPALALYFRYPLLAFLLGFASIGVVLLPCLTVAFGCSLSFSVSCFTAAFGADGVLLAMAVFGIRCLVTLPCYLLLAAPSWGASASLARLSLGGRRAAASLYGREWWLRPAACAGVLLAGMCLDMTCSPWLLRLALRRIVGTV